MCCNTIPVYKYYSSERMCQCLGLVGHISISLNLEGMAIFILLLCKEKILRENAGSNIKEKHDILCECRKLLSMKNIICVSEDTMLSVVVVTSSYSHANIPSAII